MSTWAVEAEEKHRPGTHPLLPNGDEWVYHAFLNWLFLGAEIRTEDGLVEIRPLNSTFVLVRMTRQP